MPLWLQKLEVEGILWMLLPLLHILISHVQDGNSNEKQGAAWIPWLVLCHWITWRFFPILSVFSLSNHGYRQPATATATTTTATAPAESAGDVPGSAMAIVLPTMMLYSMAQWDSSWFVYAKVMAFSGLASFQFSSWVAIVAVGACLAAALRVLPSLHPWIILLAFRVVGVLLQPIQTIVTMGEFHVLQSVLSVAVVEWSILLVETNTYLSLHEIPYGVIALSGLLGCGLTCLVVARLKGLGVRLVTSFLGPLVMIETTLWWILINDDDDDDGEGVVIPLLSLSKSFGWLFHFLWSVEETTSAGMPQWYGLVYWAVALVILGLATIWIVMRSRQHSSSVVVVTRKWFHFVAIVLFTPITLAFPRLMGLGYAIATCGLMLLEILRHNIPLLQQFYQTLLDTTKDDENGDMVISHLLLVVGCAAPLWMAQLCRVDSTLLQLWGVLVLGVGDAMGAIIGKWYGRHVWGKNQRTIEGSLAMGCSTICVGMVVLLLQGGGGGGGGGESSKSPPSPLLQVLLLLLATIVCTLLEAFTWQMDNLVLPLAGSVILLLLLKI
jgi:dolichol kinase